MHRDRIASGHVNRDSNRIVTSLAIPTPTVDTAVHGLKRQGKSLDNPSCEVTVMFITNCPDAELSLIFSCKPLEEWSATDVHVRLDEHHQETTQQHQSSNPVGSPQTSQAVNVLQCHVQSAGGGHAPQPVATARKTSLKGSRFTMLSRFLRVCYSKGPPGLPGR